MTVGAWAIGVVIMLGGSAAIVGLIFRGLSQKYTEVFLKKAIKDWWGNEDTRKERTEFVKTVIDDQVHRDDGLIRSALDKAVDSANKETIEKLDDLIATTKQNTDLYNQVLHKLSHIEGSVDILKGALKLPKTVT